MNKLIASAVVCVLAAFILFSSAPTASANVLYFDDITSTVDPAPVPNGYGGFNWDNFYVAHKNHRPGSGYDLGCVSPDYVAFNGAGKLAVVSGDVFTFVGAYLTSAWLSTMGVTVEGYLDGYPVYNTTVSVVDTGPTWYSFNYVGVDELYFESSVVGQQFAMDNFTYTPEPATIVLLGLGALSLIKGKK